MGSDLSALLISVVAALVVTALLIAETYLLSATKYDIWTLEDQTDSITGIASGNIQIIRETTESTSVNNNLNYIIRANEYIQIAFPNYYSTKIYPTYCS